MKNAQTTQDSPSNDIILDSCTKRLHTGFLGASRRCKLFQLHLGYFFSDAMLTSMVCLAAGHRKLFSNENRKHAHCRKLFHAAQNTHVAVSSPQCSPTSTPQTASRQRRLRSSTRIKFVPFSPPHPWKFCLDSTVFGYLHRQWPQSTCHHVCWVFADPVDVKVGGHSCPASAWDCVRLPIAFVPYAGGCVRAKHAGQGEARIYLAVVWSRRIMLQ